MHPLRMLSVAVAAVWLPCAASADDYPTKPIRLIIPTAPGGLMDVAARVSPEYLDKALGQRLIIDNRSDSGGTSAPRRSPRRTRTATRSASCSSATSPSIRMSTPT